MAWTTFAKTDLKTKYDEAMKEREFGYSCL